MLVFNIIFALVWIIFDRQNIFLSQADTADVLLPLHKFLHNYRFQAKLVIVVQQFLYSVTDIHVLSTASQSVFQDTGKANIVDDALPVQRVDEVTQALVMHDARDVIFVWQDERFGAGNPQFGSEGCLEELVIGGPHEGVIDDRRALQDGVLKIEPVIGYLVRDAVNDDRVRAWLIHARAAKFDEFGDHTFVAPVHFFDEDGREGPFPTDEQAYLQCHSFSPLLHGGGKRRHYYTTRCALCVGRAWRRQAPPLLYYEVRIVRCAPR